MRFTLRSALLPLALAGIALVALMACRSSSTTPPPVFGGVGPITVSCDTGAASVLVSGAPILVTAQVLRGGIGDPGETVVFDTNRGTFSPSQAVTDNLGLATSFFRPPATPGLATITMTVVDRLNGDTSSTTCTVSVTSPRDPELTVTLLSPSQAAGISVRIIYDPTRVNLPAGAVAALPPFNSGDCSPIFDDDDLGVATLNIACSQTQLVTGAVARFVFQHLSGPELTLSDFTITCTAFDTAGRPLGSACSSAILQL